MDRREFAAWVPALLAMGVAMEGRAEDAKPLEEIVSGVYKPGAEHGDPTQRVSRSYLKGRLKAGNLQIEIHETTQKEGATHEPVGTHRHNEIWLVRSGTVELMTNGVTRRMEAGDVGLCAAGDEHWVRNAGPGPCSYFVVTVGPPEV